MTLHHELSGPADAPVLVLGNSLGTTTALWEPQLPELAERFRVLRYDHRGHGGSPASRGPRRIDDLAEDVLELLDALGVRRVSYCGVSMGAMVGMWLAGHAPERIDRLVLCCTTATYDTARPWEERAAAVRANGTGSIAPAVVSRWFTPALRERSPQTVARFEHMLSTVDDESYAGCCEALGELDLRAVLSKIVAPTAVIAGARDEATPPESLRAIADAIPGASLSVVDAAHLANVEAPDAVAEILREHLK
ncbi:3-oxoadipate enol-lactonase [Actinosynnema sp. NPDC047251]|uniref:3-oxoadipate enol-lactonase n=1 Tax=Saccharothrix espanaensis (strain ATCC 51144 / DSM 44229 / JCM 9112 / NBRC 15066 / NRRL 15764) TaxID=1179773 RepID=K0K4Y9_SACES|nr:3-oxoadipate enol-lactonase [Saccharothrix espanaensis]CCH33371.1 3-oxoadipate enol-lactonase [Saccharothrix espanaensis DSM 44229]